MEGFQPPFRQSSDSWLPGLSANRRPMALEPHALEQCVWENRHSSDWVVALHSFEEYLHSPSLVAIHGHFPLQQALRHWAAVSPPNIVVFEIFQTPMGGVRNSAASSVMSAWTHRPGRAPEEPFQGGQPFSWIVDPRNCLQTAVHFAQPRADGQGIVVLTPDKLRVNHYVDFGSNADRCSGLHPHGCQLEDTGILWSEAAVLRMRRPLP
eukprot:TRINITY_DN12949_c0_g1_i2.p1 TRINITY_DN12949_c0_g1~~TRINITY_DN12949_c0_g1_i2.p1  ORF type:complete len:209 (-),score=25.68 TRINITY_DN12949_c0_g1_i2:68-694(-)